MQLNTYDINQLLFTCSNSSQQLQPKLNYTVLLQHYRNEFEYCQQVLNRFLTNFNSLTLDTCQFYSNLILRADLNLKSKGKVNLLVTFTQRFVTQSKLSLIFTKTLYFHIKQPIFRITLMTHTRIQECRWQLKV